MQETHLPQSNSEFIYSASVENWLLLIGTLLIVILGIWLAIRHRKTKGK